MREFAYGAEAAPTVDMEFVAFQAKPSFRDAEVEGVPSIDVTQTTFPEKWRHLPVYRWMTATPFQVVEKMRGMGLQRPDGLTMHRDLWLSEAGTELTCRDRIRGTMQQVWRLDIADGQELGAVRSADKGQLITTNPDTGAHGVEIRDRNLALTAVGHVNRTDEVSAIGWKTDVDALSLDLHLPPGWRMFALFGPDWVRGDWLTAWTLLDLFLLLIFALAVFRLWGPVAGAIAFLAFGLAYHEPNAPRWAWLFLLMPLALLKVAPEGALRKCLLAWRMIAVVALVIFLAPFIAGQLQSAMYPQLESRGETYRSHGLAPIIPRMAAMQTDSASELMAQRAGVIGAPPTTARKRYSGRLGSIAKSKASNLAYDPKAKIQTGPAEPTWQWIRVRAGWNGPVSETQTVRPILLSPALHRSLTMVRVLLLLMLAGVLLGVRRLRNPLAPPPASAALAACLFVGLCPSATASDLPSQHLLDGLQQRLLEVSSVYPHGAAIPEVQLDVEKDKILMRAEIHCAVEAAVPIPGKLPSWSPISVHVDGNDATLLRRRDGFLWVVLPAGVHNLTVQGLLPAADEWAWTFRLTPKRVSVNAPGWQVTGIRPNGVPENQVFFSRQQKDTEREAAYDRKNFNPVLVLDRQFEVGLEWQVHSRIVRESKPGQAVSLRVPLLPGETVFSPNVVVKEGFVEARLGAGDMTFEWDSEMPVGTDIHLQAEVTDRWVERWRLITSPVWHATLEGLAPLYEVEEQLLVPVWQPWPGERVGLTFSKPEAVGGETVTVRSVNHVTTMGSRRRITSLKLDIESSQGDEFRIGLDPAAEITSLEQGEQAIPVGKDGSELIIPITPGKEQINVGWQADDTMAFRLTSDRVELPVEVANISSQIRMPDSRWILWAAGPLRGPAVRFWTLLAVALVAAWVLGTLRLSPIGRVQWTLLALGLTQVHVVFSLLVIGWFFLLAWRGSDRWAGTSFFWFNTVQLILVLLTGAMLIVLVNAVGAGLLGHPDMFIRGQHSSRLALNWFQPTSGTILPGPEVWSISVWYYRLFMLAWALWLASALIHWLKWGWEQFSHETLWKSAPKRPVDSPPPIGKRSS